MVAYTIMKVKRTAVKFAFQNENPDCSTFNYVNI
jgi:hypothetical protein